MIDWMKQWDCCSPTISSENVHKDVLIIFGDSTILSQNDFVTKSESVVNLCLFYGFFQFVANFTVERVWYQVKLKI